MAYLTINKAADSGLFVSGSLRKYKDTVHEKISELWLKKRPGTTPPRIDVLLEFMADDLDEERIEMVGSLSLYLNESAGNEFSNLDRNNAVGDMRHWYRFSRDSCLNVCSEERVRELGFDLVTEEHPWRLERQVQRAINGFKDLDPDAHVEADDPRKQELAPRHGFILDSLTPPHGRLVEELASWHRQRRDTEEAFLQKNGALDSYRKKFSIHAKCSEMLYRWAGLEEEAKRIKPSTRRPGQRAEVADRDSASDDGAANTDAANTDAADPSAEGDAAAAPDTGHP